MSAYNFWTSRNNFTKLFHVTCRRAGVIMRVWLLGAHPQQCLGGQNVQNLARYFTTFDFDHKYLRNRST